MQELKVNLGERSYPIFIGAGNLNSCGEYIKRQCRGGSNKVLLTVDKNVNALYAETVHDSLERAGLEVSKKVISPGEKSKSLAAASEFYDLLLDQGFERSSAVIGLGGGVVGDLSGFVAATYMRGIDFVLIPTSLLAQVDSSIGGKVAVNHERAKNIIGAFYQPEIVYMDMEVLRTLPDREFRSGLAEIIKHGLGFDADFFRYLGEHREDILSLKPGVLSEVIRRSCQIKKEIVQRDEKEENVRARLNLGHTIGHALEAADSYSTFNHGEAVAVGMVAEAMLSAAEGMMAGDNVAELKDLLEKYHLPVRIPAEFSMDELIELMKNDKKSRDGRVEFALPADTGKTLICRDWDSKNLRAVLEELSG